MTGTADSDPTIAVNILVVDDRVENRVALRAILDDADYRIVEASSARDALRQLLDVEFALLLIDVVMPEMGGLELARLVRQRSQTASVPILFLTAEATDIEAIYTAYRTGAVDYLVKPLVPEMVQAKVAVFAELYRQRKRLELQGRALIEAGRVEAQLRYRNLAEAVPHVVWTADAQGNVEYLSRRFHELTGRKPDGSGFMDVLHPDDRDAFSALWRAAIEGGTPFETECRLTAKRGDERWHLCRSVPERDAAGKIIGWIGTFTDIDEQKQMHALLDASYEKALAAIRARDEFLSIASHELKTPLTALQLQVESLLAEAEERRNAEPFERWTSRIGLSVRQVERLGRLVNELLDVSRITTGRLQLEPDWMDLAELVRETASRTEEQCARARSEVILAAEQPVRGRWDRSRLEQVLSNLLSNAIKFGAGQPIEIAVEERSRGARLTVRDHGIGIDCENLERIFGRFERAVSARSYGGLGLGLFIVREIVSAHGGTVGVESAPGEGATFIVDLPEQAPASAPAVLLGTG